MFISVFVVFYCLVIALVSDWKFLKKLGLEVVLNVSSRGDGLVLFLPKNVAETYAVVAGDRLKVCLNDHFRKVVDAS